MKTQNLLSNFIFLLLSNFAISQNQNFNAATIVGVEIEMYDSLGNKVEVHHADVHCLWTINEDFTILYYSEYLENGTILRSINYEIVNRYEDETIRHLVIKNGENYFGMMFWKDEDLVAYEFGNTVTMLSGQIEY